MLLRGLFGEPTTGELLAEVIVGSCRAESAFPARLAMTSPRRQRPDSVRRFAAAALDLRLPDQRSGEFPDRRGHPIGHRRHRRLTASSAAQAMAWNNRVVLKVGLRQQFQDIGIPICSFAPAHGVRIRFRTENFRPRRHWCLAHAVRRNAFASFVPLRECRCRRA